jgi:hypothetical protein
MTPRDVAGVFSRYFIVGFFLPAFFALVALTQSLSSAALPNIYEQYGDGTRLALVGGAALLLGLVLLGLNYQILQAFEGYPLQARKDGWYARSLYEFLHGRELERYSALVAIRDSEDAPAGDRADAAWRINYRFSDDLMPTSFGNAVRSFERHARVRWGLNSISAWPRIEMLLTEQQREIETNARGEVAFFVNGCLLAAIVGVLLVIDEALAGVTALLLAWVYLVPFVLAYAFYRWAVGAAVRWGNAVRATIDLRRFELYDLLGLRAPGTFTEERETLAPALNRCLLYGDPLPDEFRKPPAEAGTRQDERDDE